VGDQASRPYKILNRLVVRSA